MTFSKSITGVRNIFFIAVNTGYSTQGNPNRDFIEFYRQRSGNGLYCAIVGNVVIPDGFGSNEFCSKISNHSVWSSVATAIRDEGAKPGIQLASTWQGYKGNIKFIPQDYESAINHYLEIGKSFTKTDVKNAFQSLTKASKLAIDHGFSHLQLHAAHGYLFNLLLDSRFSNLSNLALELATDWAQNMKQAGIETSMRISILTGDLELDNSDRTINLSDFCNTGFDYLDISEGFYNIDKKLIYPTSEKQLLERFTRSTNRAKQHSQQLFIISGKIFSTIHNDIPKNVHLGVCRDLIANPEYLSNNKPCQNCMKCHYHSRGASKLECSLWQI
ncbi:hypothetical protein [Paracidovorax valerianellae]|uniref:NADPH2 dehydrogenase n=1 Tax=Paracidovorax valerianellae TaxID=187868 RepID=A0A1G6JZ47_9BURK|nr:hypothetical protein [Paracidovorax valerianellae]MDA8445227.1 hypothetical protein [Paracidovorax valerianellae]SDC24010.1 NADPH2 dehydrogenase [Paracidovorax valerianellae]